MFSSFGKPRPASGAPLEKKKSFRSLEKIHSIHEKIYEFEPEQSLIAIRNCTFSNSLTESVCRLKEHDKSDASNPPGGGAKKDLRESTE